MKSRGVCAKFHTARRPLIEPGELKNRICLDGGLRLLIGLMICRGVAALTRAYLITSVARASRDGGTVRPSALAVLRLITSSNLLGCRTGRSAGLVPFRILPT